MKYHLYIGSYSREGISQVVLEDGVLRMLARPLRAPFTLDITMRFSGSSAEVALAGVGPEKTTAILQKD